MRSEVWLDAEGVWKRDGSGREDGIRWNELYRVGAYPTRRLGPVKMVLEFERESGEFFEVLETFEGFATLVITLANHLDGVSEGWPAKAMRMPTDQDILTVWERA